MTGKTGIAMRANSGIFFISEGIFPDPESNVRPVLLVSFSIRLSHCAMEPCMVREENLPIFKKHFQSSTCVPIG